MRTASMLLLFIFHSDFFFSSGQSGELCVSPGGHFPSFSSNGKPPDKVPKGPKDLVFCRVFRRKTCCDVSQTYPALLSIRKLASTGEASEECLNAWEHLECSICDPRVGTRPGPPMICSSLCDLIFKACSTAYFSIDAMTQVLSPCGLNDILCGQASEWVSNGTELCRIAGFSVKPSGIQQQSAEEQFCYAGKISLGSDTGSMKSSRPKSPRQVEIAGIAQEFQRWITGMAITERISWAVGGMVLTVGLAFISKRKNYRHRLKAQNQSAILNKVKMREARANQQASYVQRKTGGRAK